MFSQLGPLFRTTFRQAESTDTRQAIRHDEEKDERRNQGSDEKKQSAEDMWEDSTDVSVTSLRAFLINFLKTMPEAETGGTKTDAPSSEKVEISPAAEHLEPKTTVAARAMKAYQSIAEKTGGETPSTPPSDPVTAPLVSTPEVRTMHQLIADLDALSKAGLQTLHIERADTFLESLVNAVRLAKSKI